MLHKVKVIRLECSIIIFSQRHFIWKESSYKLQRGLIRLEIESSGAHFKSQKMI